MTHTAKENLAIYKEKHNQLQPKRTDAADWEEAMKETNKKPRPQQEKFPIS
jgi:hypothetical protein